MTGLPAVVAQSGGVSFAQFFLIVLALMACMAVAGWVVARRTQPQRSLAHATTIGKFEPGVVGNLIEFLDHAAAGEVEAQRWVDAFIRHSIVDAVALRYGLPRKEAVAHLREHTEELPSTIRLFLDGRSLRKRWRLRRLQGIKPKIPRRFSLKRIILPWHVATSDLYLQDVKHLFDALDEYSRGQRA